MPENTLCLMLKAPRTGEVKTRLARDVGDAGAAEIYRAMVEHQLREIPRGWRIEVHFTPQNAAEEMRSWLQALREERIDFFPQAEGDLGIRLRAALFSAIGRGAQSVLFAGGDCPGLDCAVLTAAAMEIANNDLVLVPAVDGGYVLIGMKALHAGVFDGIHWSTPEVFEQTLVRAERLGLETELLPALEDVDDLQSWERVRRLLANGSKT